MKGRLIQLQRGSVFISTEMCIRDRGTLLAASDMETAPGMEPGAQEQTEKIAVDFKDALLAKDQAACIELLSRLYRCYSENRVFLPNQVKDIYYKLFISINDCRQTLKLSHDPSETSTEESIIDHLERCFTYQELHQLLVTRTEQFFAGISACLLYTSPASSHRTAV